MTMVYVLMCAGVVAGTISKVTDIVSGMWVGVLLAMVSWFSSRVHVCGQLTMVVSHGPMHRHWLMMCPCLHF